MNCPKCDGDTKVNDRRGVRRRRECLACKHRFTTIEVFADELPKKSKEKNPVIVSVEKPPEVVTKPKTPKPTPSTTVTISKIKRSAEARRKIEDLRDSFMDPDYDYLPDSW